MTNNSFINGMTIDDIKCMPYGKVVENKNSTKVKFIERVPYGFVYTFETVNDFNSVFIPLGCP